MLDYETFSQIRDHLGRQQLSVAQTARALGLDVRTVAKWANVEQFRPRTGRPRVGKLDAYKGQIVRWLDAHPTARSRSFSACARPALTEASPSSRTTCTAFGHATRRRFSSWTSLQAKPPRSTGVSTVP